MIRLATALSTFVGVYPVGGIAQAVPESFGFGEFEVGLNVVTLRQVDIRSIGVFELDGLTILEVKLSPHLNAEFEAATRGKIGYQVSVRVCNRMLMQAILRNELSEAAIVLSSGDPDRIRAAADLIREPPCSDV